MRESTLGYLSLMHVKLARDCEYLIWILFNFRLCCFVLCLLTYFGRDAVAVGRLLG